MVLEGRRRSTHYLPGVPSPLPSLLSIKRELMSCGAVHVHPVFSSLPSYLPELSPIPRTLSLVVRRRSLPLVTGARGVRRSHALAVRSRDPALLHPAETPRSIPDTRTNPRLKTTQIILCIL